MVDRRLKVRFVIVVAGTRAAVHAPHARVDKSRKRDEAMATIGLRACPPQSFPKVLFS